MRWILLCLPFSCVAGDFSLVIGTLSHHTVPPPPLELIDAQGHDLALIESEWNETNATLGVEYTLESEGWRTILTLANYEDSYLRDSWYGGIGLMYPLTDGPLKIEGGAYLLYFEHDEFRMKVNENITYIVPSDSYTAPVPGLSVTYGFAGANLSVIPPVRSGMPWTGAIQLKLVF